MNDRWCLLIFCLALSCVRTALGIACYQCKSNEDMHCSERFDKSMTDQEPGGCDDIFEARYCIKTTGIYGGEIGTRRFCSSRDHGNYCEYIRRPGDEWEYRSCVYTCTADGCNAGFVPRTSFFAVAVLVLAAIVHR